MAAHEPTAAPHVDVAVAAFTPEERAKILKALGGEDDYHYGTRAGYLLRTCTFLKFSPRAMTLYLLLSGFLGADKKLPRDTVRVSMRVIAMWLRCDIRTAQRAVRELTRSGPLPLLMEKPGRPGRVSEYRFVRDPFKIAAIQAVEALVTKNKRGAAIVAAQADIQTAQSRGELGPADGADKLRRTGLRREWNTPTRLTPVVVVPRDQEHDGGQDHTRSAHKKSSLTGDVTSAPVPKTAETTTSDNAQSEQPPHLNDLRKLKERLAVIAERKRF